MSRHALQVAALAVLVVTMLGCAGPPAEGPDLLLISIDTLRADHLPPYGYPRQTAPFLSSLAAEGLVFDHDFVPLPATDPSHASLLTALHPLEHGVLANARLLTQRVETLAEVLQEHGYATFGAVAVGHLGGRYGFGQGFDEFSDEWIGDGRVGRERRSAEAVNRSVFKMMDAYAERHGRRPYFLFVHYFDVHAAYRQEEIPVAGPGVDALFARASNRRRDMIRRYDGCIRYVDEQIRQLVAHLEAQGLSDNLLTVVTSDHGEQLGEHGHVGAHADIYVETVRVPLIVHGSSMPTGVVARPVSSMDVPVFLLQQAGLAFSKPVSGRSLLDDSPRRRPLLILGYPAYTRSLGVVDYPRWWIENFDPVYRYVGHEPRGDAPPPSRGGRWVEARRIDESGNEAVYDIRMPQPRQGRPVQPVAVTVDVQVRDEGCEVTATVNLEPGLKYFRGKQRPRFSGAHRIVYPALTTDRTSVRVSPAVCDVDVFYRLARLAANGEREDGWPRAVESRIWQHLLSLRKDAPGDELYDLEQDPRMLRNLVDAAGMEDAGRSLSRSMNELLWRRLQAAVERPGKPVRYSDEEVRMLKSLGYLQ